MSRRTTAKKRLAVPDPLYNSRLVSMLTVRILNEGKKQLAQRIIYQALDIYCPYIQNVSEVCVIPCHLVCKLIATQ
jgi:ribosomal protein S7